MKILFVSEYYPPKIMGGGEINLSLLAKSLVKNKIEVSVITSYHKGLKRLEKVEGVKVYRTLETGSTVDSIKSNIKRGITFPKSVIKEVKNLTKKKKFYAIHFIGTSIIAAPKLSKLKIPLFATIESYPTLCPKGDRIYQGKQECKVVCSFNRFLSCQANSKEIGKMKNKPYMKYNPLFLSYVYNHHQKLKDSLKYCNLIAISKYIQNVLKQHGHESTVIPNAINLKTFTPIKKNNKKLKLVYLGAFIRSKGPHVVLKSLKNLKINSYFYGDGVMKNDLLKIADQENLDTVLHPPVSYDRVPSIYQNADIVVFPSLWPEPFGRIAIEAMATGTAVIGSSIGGIKETIHKGAGILVSPGNTEELNKAIKKLIENKKLRKKMGKRGREIVKQKYSEGMVIKSLIELYSSSSQAL